MFIVMLSLLSSFSWASLPHTPYSEMIILNNNKWDNGYPATRYHEVLNHVMNVYSPIISERGGRLFIKKVWADNAVNMWADRYENRYILEVPGGFARYYLITEEGFLATVCHELGHLLGGLPASGDISFEGQSDYYATETCMNLVMPGLRPYKEVVPDTEVAAICKEDEHCARVLMGAKSVTAMYAELERKPAPQLSTPSKVVVKKTNTKHPPAQCRLDTMYAGFEKRPRPACWYKEVPQ